MPRALHVAGHGAWASQSLSKPYHKPYTWQAMALLLGGGMALAGRITPQQLTSFYLYVDFVVAASLSVCDQWGAIMVRNMEPLAGSAPRTCWGPLQSHGRRSLAGCRRALGQSRHGGSLHLKLRVAAKQTCSSKAL